MKISAALILSSLSSVAFSAPAPAPADSHHEDHHKDEKPAVVTVTQYIDSNAATSTVESAATTTTLSSSEKDTSEQKRDGGFQDGTVKCSDFPSVNGIVSLDWLGFGGWASVMDMDANTSSECKDGYYCSYACEPGMSKTQWPSDQPSDGKSVGGLYCKNGYLYRTNTDTSDLCSTDETSAKAINKKSDSIALCRTDYPGSENMVIPTVVDGGDSQPISVVDEDTYYQWQGKKTSAQYYINNAGVSAEDGCIWGTSGSDVGNWAPLVLGAGSTNGETYLSLIPNPNSNQAANFNVKIVASDGANVQGSCAYEDGSFTGDGSDGCTVSVLSGSAEFAFY